MKKRILIKLSGGAVKPSNQDKIFDIVKLDNFAKQLAKLSKEYNIGIVNGGGNIWRGAMDEVKYFSKHAGNDMGMVATILNGIALKNAIENNSASADLFSSLELERIAKPVSFEAIEDAFSKNKIVIFAGGTGFPYFTTDTASVLRALDMKANFILMGKDGVDGVYSADPKKDSTATRFDNLSYDQIIAKNLKVMDQTALTLCKDHDVEIIVFNINEDQSMIKAIEGKAKVTKISR